MPETRTFIDTIEEEIENQEVRQLFIQYGTPTITLSSDRMQLVNHDGFDEVDSVFLDDDFELLIGSK
jgi:hypothetical protein